MNAERLHAVASELKADFAATNVPELLDQLSTQLSAWVDNPADVSAAQDVANSREQLSGALLVSRVKQFSDSWRLALEELGAWDIVGDQLRSRIEDIFTQNEITPSIAYSEVKALSSQVQQLNSDVTNLVAAFESVGIGAEALAQGEFEVGFLIPRAAVGNMLDQLGAEFEELDKIVKPFEELAGEGRPDIEVRTISSSAFMIFLVAAPGVALTLSKVVESLLSSYVKIREIREKAAGLEEAGVPPEALEGLKAHANERMELDIQALANEIVGQSLAQLPEGRPHELKVEIKHSLRQMAKRIDEGYSIEVRAFVPEDGDEETAEGVLNDDVINAARQITERQPRMRAMNLTGRPILELGGGDDEEDAAGSEAPSESDDA